MILYESISALHGDLCKPAIFMKYVEDVAFSNLFCKEIAYHEDEYPVGMTDEIVRGIPTKSREPCGNLSHVPSAT